MKPTVKLLTEIIDVQCLFEIINEEQTYYFDAECDVDLRRTVLRIKEARNLKSKYLTILN